MVDSLQSSMPKVLLCDYPLIHTRFWHSSAAYAIATEVGCGDASTIPPEGHDIYKWPQDLLKPDVSSLTYLASYPGFSSQLFSVAR